MKQILIFLGLTAISVVLFVLSIAPLSATVFEALDDKLYAEFHKKSGPIIAVFSTEDECKRGGGDWLREGPRPMYGCSIPAKDGNRPCISGFQCEYGSCIRKYEFRDGLAVGTGTCAKYRKLYGCIQWMHFGLSGKAVCID